MSVLAPEARAARDGKLKPIKRPSPLDSPQRVDPLPSEMLRARRWLHHNKNKKPIYTDGTARRGALDSPEDTARLDTYTNALKTLKPNRGLGFALGGNFQGIDLDGVRDPDTGALHDWAQVARRQLS